MTSPFRRSPFSYDATPEERMRLLTHAVTSAYNVPLHVAAQLVGHVLADQLKQVDTEIGRIENPYRMGRKWAEGVKAAQSVLFMRQLRLRATRVKTRPLARSAAGESLRD